MNLTNRMELFETPYLTVDVDRLEQNIYRLQAYLDENGIANRPHIKTHKIPAIAKMQLAAGAVGITCQKISEAEVMANAGIEDIFLPYNILGQKKLKRLMALAERTKISVTADSSVVADGLSRAAIEADLFLSVLVECDLGYGRCGVQSPTAAAELARYISSLPNLHFRGLMTYPNSENLDAFVQTTQMLLKPDPIRIDIVSGGGSACMWQTHTLSEITEHRAGMYIFGDRNLLNAKVMTLDDIALGVKTTVVSRPTLDRAILDCGSKTLSSDTMGLEGFGYLREYPNAHLYNLSEEHGFLDLSACDRKPELGEQVTVIPNHCCPVVNLADELVGTRKNQFTEKWHVAARGKVV
ncbi:MAG: D-TA family PLP-dependent enzyme [Anaerolineae bacterium]|nr:D-TA family PLP-dependent enzyme [Anaerolineae bacterium]